ncbi:MAG: ATP-dependent helicase [Elusimicrobia bacterium]|nr:ATP-dependent helicase [Elusimicrobiota bacterium]
MPIAEQELSEAQKEVIAYRGGHLQVIACAGSGKTESISRRVAELINEGNPPESIIAFTFTEKAAAELKERIYSCVEAKKGHEFLGRLGPMFVGTIHGYCFRLLQDYVPKFGNYDVLDEHRHSGLLSRAFYDIGLQKLKRRNAIKDFLHSADVISNELLDARHLAGTPLGECYEVYVSTLERYHFLSFGLIIAQAVKELKNPATYERVHGPLRHLIVDEYQDINPAQERLIELLAKDPVQLCVVGDDDQAIYQWRGSELSNIINFKTRWKGSKKIALDVNRRSRPEIIRTANDFAKTIPHRFEKAMREKRPGGTHEVIPWCSDTDAAEAKKIAETIARLSTKGVSCGDIAVLYRSVRTSSPPLIEALEEAEIPYQCAGRTGLFLQPEINLFGEIYAWLIEGEWRDEQYAPKRATDIAHVVADISRLFRLKGAAVKNFREYLEDWKLNRLHGKKPVNLVGDFYDLLFRLGAHEFDLSIPRQAAKFGAFARFSRILADFEHVTRRGRYVEEEGQRVFRGGRDRGPEYYKRLHKYLLYYARDAYEDFDGEPIFTSDAVSIITVHQAKGLEWPIVFLPALTDRRFPSGKAGDEKDWLLPEAVFPKEKRKRYEGGDAEERRLFYVAMTRARDALYLSHFEKKKNSFKPSPYLIQAAKANGGLKRCASLPLPEISQNANDEKLPLLEMGFTDIASYEDCGHRYRLASSLDFQQKLVIELGYGKAIHHILRHVAEIVRATGKVPSRREAEKIVADKFYLPFADNPTFERMVKAASKVLGRYLDKHSEDLKRVWAIERPFEIHLPDAIITGKADVILDHEQGLPGRLAIVDYKSTEDPERSERYEQQVAVYAAAGRGEGLTVAAGYLHNLNNGSRQSVDVSDHRTQEAVARLRKAVDGIRKGQFDPQPEEKKCSACDYGRICRFSKAEG